MGVDHGLSELHGKSYYAASSLLECWSNQWPVVDASALGRGYKLVLCIFAAGWSKRQNQILNIGFPLSKFTIAIKLNEMNCAHKLMQYYILTASLTCRSIFLQKASRNVTSLWPPWPNSIAIVVVKNQRKFKPCIKHHIVSENEHFVHMQFIHRFLTGCVTAFDSFRWRWLNLIELESAMIVPVVWRYVVYL